jgi:hypothetical protein
MTRHQLISAVSLLAAMASTATAAPGRAVITPEQVAAAISGAAMKVLPEQVTLLSEVIAKSNSPTLNVESIEPWGSHRMKVRLGCANQEQCLPFYVSVRFDQESGAKPSVALVDQASAMSLRLNHEPKEFVVRAGSKATLLLDGGHVHIRLSVVCLENGAAGQKIRVECKDPKQTYVAEVVEGGILRGSL